MSLPELTEWVAVTRSPLGTETKIAYRSPALLALGLQDQTKEGWVVVSIKERPRKTYKEASRKAAEWLEAWAAEEKVDLTSFSPGQRFVAAMKVPCSIRCWRVGDAVEVEPNSRCPECGKENVVTRWDLLRCIEKT
jgi:hypothetical protein